MPTVTLLSKVYNNRQLKLVENQLKSTLKGLKVKIENVEAAPRGWIQVNFSGEDEKAALSYLEEEIGLCPVRIENLKKFSTTKGYIIGLGGNKDELRLDIGITSPRTMNATIPLQHLQAQLADGRKIALKKLIELFGFCENLPLKAKITRINENHIQATIAENQLKLYRKWTKSLLDRLIILGASQQEIKTALRNSRCQNDIVEIEQLGLFENAVACKLGTDAVGLIPKVGRNLPNTILSIFKPNTILEFFQNFYLT
ncbi:MAG: DUF2110 family protein [Candidatus Bathyarchaeales archaeon]